MRKKNLRILSMILSFCMLSSSVPVNVQASQAAEAESASSIVAVASESTNSVPASMSKISKVETKLAPGVLESQYVVLDKNGDRVVYYVVNADVASNENVQVKANYHDNDNTGVWGKATVVEQANAAKEKRGYNVVASTNASYYNVSTGQPTGGFVMEGVNINGNSAGNSYPFFAVMKDGTAMIGQKGTFSQYVDNIQEAVGGWTMLVWDGENVATDNSKYPRSTVGIKENGDIVLMVADGNQKPYSAGLTKVEQAEVMISLGCVAAVELDGGGSATYAAKPEGTDEVVVRNSCCDGTVRSVSNTLMVVSTAVADGTFDHANLSTEYAYYVPNSEVTVNAIGADAAGGPADIPEDVTWALSDDSFGTVADGKFVSNGTLGDVEVQMIYGDAVVGSTTISVVNPESIAFDTESKSIPFGKTTALTINALYNKNNVYIGIDALELTLSDNDAAVIDGAMFTAAKEESGKTGVTVTAKYKYADIAETSVVFNFGKESTVLFDFENEEDSRWTGDYKKAKEVLGDKISDNSTWGNYQSAGITVNADISDAQAKTGENSLAVNIDYTQSTEHANWQYMYLYYLGDPVIYRDVENGVMGTRIGMWMYIPEEAVGMCARLAYSYYEDAAKTKKNTNYLYLTYQYVEKGFSKLSSATIPEAGWAYVYVDFFDDATAGKGGDYFSSAQDDWRKNGAEPESDYYPAFIQFIASSSHSGCENMTFYIDDITLDYGDVTPDRDAPIVSDMKLYTADGLTSAALGGNTIDYNEITVSASVAEDFSHAATNATGLNTDTAQVYVDGNAVGASVVNGILSSNVITLPDGEHDITFEIADKEGNYTRVTKQITVKADTTYPSITVSGQAMQEGMLKTGSLYNIFVNVDQIEKIKSITTTIHLGSAHEFELEHMKVPYGFTASYTENKAARTADITVTRTGECELTGSQTLVTVPARVWMWDGSAGYDAATQWNTNKCAPVLNLEYKVNAGSVEYVEGYNVDAKGYVAGFSNIKASVVTELNTSIANIKNEGRYWHIHTDYKTTWKTENKEATCTEEGYENRVTCGECNSVIDWGTTIPATGHIYAVVEGVCKCANCDKLYTGIFENKEYIDGQPIGDGWITIGEHTYYYVDGRKVTGAFVIDNVVYTFDENGVYQEDVQYSGFIETDSGVMYFLTKDTYVTGYSYIANTPYYFDRNGIAYDGEHTIGGEVCQFEAGKYVSCSTADVVLAGLIGEQAYFVLYSNGTMKFSGTGDVFFHQSAATIPWNKNKDNITKVVVGKDVTYIPRFAFAHSYGITEVIFESGSKLETISYQSFHYLNKIKKLVLPNSVKRIEWCAFGYWSSLRTVYLPDNIEYIHPNAFLNHHTDLVIQVAEGTYAHEYAVSNGFKYEVREKTPQIIASGLSGDAVNWTLYDTGVFELSGSGAMEDYNYAGATAAPWKNYRSQITSVKVGKDVKSIGKFAFYSCANLTSVEFEENSVFETIGWGSFGYTGIKEVTIPASVKELLPYAFYYSKALEKVAFEENSALRSIGTQAFIGDESLVNVYIPDHVNSIGSVAFRNCNAQLKLSVPEGSYAHRYATTNNIAVELREAVAGITAEGTCGENLSWTLYEDGVMKLSGSGAMTDYSYAGATAAPWKNYRSQIISVKVGKSVKSIGKFAFYSCANLISVEFEENSTLETIGWGAFGYTGIKEVTIPASVKELLPYAFYYSKALEKVAFEENSALRSIGTQAFIGDESLVNVYIPDYVNSIGSVAFRNCNAQLKLSVPEGSYAHRYATTNNIAVELRESVAGITVEGTCGENLSWTLYEDGVMKLSGSGAMTDYSYAGATVAPWKNYRSQITSVQVGKNVKSIGKFAFYSCANLVSVEFEENSILETIGWGAFGYTGIKEVTIPATVKELLPYAFYYCKALEKVTFEENSVLRSIETQAFIGDESLVSVYIPDGVNNIGSVAFRNCNTNLKLSVIENSYAHQYAIKNSIKVELR